jgi:hypothetical protein
MRRGVAAGQAHSGQLGSWKISKVARPAAKRPRPEPWAPLLSSARAAAQVLATAHDDAGAFTGFAMELATGSLFAAYNAGFLSPAFLHGVAVQVVSALRHAHALGVLHLDLKPDNVLVRARAHRHPSAQRRTLAMRPSFLHVAAPEARQPS